MNSIKHIISKKLTKPLPVFSHAVVYEGVAYVSCIQGFVPGTFEFPGAGTVADEAQQMLENLKSVLIEADTDWDRILSMNLYFKDLDQDFQVVNEVVNRYIRLGPARSSIGVLSLPRGCRVVIDCKAACLG